jgi:hypothetical protein
MIRPYWQRTCSMFGEYHDGVKSGKKREKVKFIRKSLNLSRLCIMRLQEGKWMHHTGNSWRKSEHTQQRVIGYSFEHRLKK